ncbi:uncharacterized protein LOC144715860 [Wolffia australiana]
MARTPRVFLAAVLLLATVVAARAIGDPAVAGLGMPDWMPRFPFPGAFPGSGGLAGAWQPSVVCSERGPCFQKRLTCPARCFTSYTRHSKNFAGGGGGGGCTFDCKRSCAAIC